MKTYNFFYYGQPITKKEFEANVPENWKDLVNDEQFSYGGYKAIERF